jgi:hypothetical protein
MYCIRVFPWARVFLDISVPLDLVVNRMTESRRKNLSRLKKQGFEFGAKRTGSKGKDHCSGGAGSLVDSAALERREFKL